MKDALQNSKINQLSERSVQVQEVLDKVPAWTIRWGTVVIAGGILSILSLTWFISFPDVVKSSLTIITSSPPIYSIAKTAGEIEALKVEDGDVVNKNQVLAVIKNSANFTHVLQLRNVIEKYDAKDVDVFLSEIAFQDNYQLGDLQNKYNVFLKNLEGYRQYIALNPIYHQIKLFHSELEQLNQFHLTQKTQLVLAEREMKLEESDFNRQKELFEDKIISAKEFEESQKKVLQYSRALVEKESLVSETEVKITQAANTIEKLKFQHEEMSRSHKLQVIESVRELKSSIQAWEQAFLIKSSISGKIALFDFWEENQYVFPGDTVLTILPQEQINIVGYGKMPIQKSGLVKEGQRVKIYLESYPSHTFGIVLGEVESISLIPKGDFYRVKIKLTNGLNTNYNKKIHFQQELKGKAEIVTDNVRLFERLLYPVIDVFRNR